ncbi:DUF6183 family protein [Streptomyces sp. NBC_01317]|uniref:DUF6183 family protein n=1 Tax=Streptomyces sp. NBC_01317 TaxID=2903822 RepID=UPI002E107171|nr:DUF6183 family protein [Streptomyces sp. NBC_01317]
MSKDIIRAVAALSEASDADVSALRAEIDLRVLAGDFVWVGDLGAQLAAQATAGKPLQAHCREVLDYVLHVLSTHPGVQSLRSLLRVPVSRHSDGSDRTGAERRLAFFVACNHRIDDIANSVFTMEYQSVHSREFMACLLQELVLQSVEVEEYPVLRSFAEKLVNVGHPLAVLPLSLLPEEHGLRRPSDAADDWTWTVPPTPFVSFGTAELRSAPSTQQRTACIGMTELTVPAVADVMGAAIQHWCTQSNGKISAQEFWAPDPVREEDFPAAFQSLPLIPWPADQAPARLYPSSSDSVLRVLLTAAVRGPAYGFGLYGAYGRLATWRSLAGLTGASADAPITHTAELVRQARWFRVDTASVWFYGVAWDLAVAVLRSGGQEIAVLAATDTD